jgi:hypothetical protein
VKERAPAVRDPGARRFVALPLAQLVPGVTRAAFAKRSPAGAALMAEWVAIVGPRLAAVTQPRRLTRGVLTVSCAGPVAMELAHLQAALIERINTHAGAGVVTGLRFTQDLVAERSGVVATPVREVVVERVEGVGEDLGGALGGLLAAIRGRGERPG